MTDSAALARRLAELDKENFSAPWEVCTEPPNDQWYAGITIGSADPLDHRRVCDMSPLQSEKTRERIGELICTMRNNLPAILRALCVMAAVDEWGSELCEARGERLTAKELVLERADELLAELSGAKDGNG